MIYFIIFYLLQLFIYILSEYFENKRTIKNILFIFSMILSILFAALRLNDPDRSSYIAIYLNEKYIPELGYNFFMKIFQSTNVLYYYYFAFINLISLIILYYNINKLSKNKMFSILIYISYLYLIKDFIEIRNAVAISLILFSIKYLKKKSYTFFIIVYISYLFHITMIVWIPLFFFANYKFSKKNYFLYYYFLLFLGSTYYNKNYFLI